MLQRIASMPGGMAERARAVATFVVPKWRWALPAAGDVQLAWQAVLPTGANWRCKGRVWAEELRRTHA